MIRVQQFAILVAVVALMAAAKLAPTAAASEAQWRSEMESAASAHRRGDVELAVRGLEAALGIAAKLAESDRFTARTLTALASIDFENGDYHSARERLRIAASTWRSGSKKEWGELTVTIMALSATNARLGELGEAEAGYREAITLIEENGGSWRQRLARAHRNLGGILQEGERFDEAADSLRKSLAIYEEVQGVDSQEATDVRASLEIAEFLATQSSDPKPSSE